LDLITRELIEEKDVKLVNFGIFKVMKKKARIGRNPRTKEEVIISERCVIKFKPSNFLVNFINSNINVND
jgi:integration host factor subunit alpha